MSEGACVWAIRSFDALPSTQRYLLEAIRSGAIGEPTAVLAAEQTAGEGSRGNRWEGGRGNFYASIAVEIARMPDDLPPQSASIYFGWLMRESLRQAGARVWLKWPNDLYCDRDKVGGVITHKSNGFYVVGIGVNLQKNTDNYQALRTDISPLILLNMYLARLEKFPNWKHLFSKFRIEFPLSRAFLTHQGAAHISMQDAVLCDDGSLQINDERMYSLR